MAFKNRDAGDENGSRGLLLTPPTIEGRGPAGATDNYATEKVPRITANLPNPDQNPTQKSRNFSVVEGREQQTAAQSNRDTKIRSTNKNREACRQGSWNQAELNKAC